MTLKSVLIITLFFQLMLQATRPLLSLYAVELGADILEVGVLTATYAFFPLLIAIYAGKITDRIGDRIPIFFGLVFGSIGLLLPFFVQAIWILYVSQMIVGMAHIIAYISLQNVLGHAANRENRDQYYGIFSMVLAISQFIGPISGGYLAEYTSYSFAFLIAAILGIIPIVTAFWIPMVKSKAMPKQKGSTLQLLKKPLLRKALGGSILVLYSRDIFIAYFPLYAVSMNISDSSIGWIIALLGLAMVPIRFFLASLSKWLGRERLLFISIIIAGLSFFIIPFTSHVPFLMLLAICMGAGLGCGEPLSMTTAYNVSPKFKTAEVLGLGLAANRLSQLTAPVLFGSIGSGIGLIAVFIVSGTFLVGGAFMTYSKDNTKVKKLNQQL